MLTLEKRLVFFMIIAFMMAIVLSPANVQSFEMTLFVQSPSGSALGDVHAFLYDWDEVQKYGLNPLAISGISITHESQSGKVIPSLELSLNKDYLLVLSTRALAEDRNHMDCFYGKRDGSFVKDTSMDYTNAPRLRYTSEISSLGIVKLPSGFYIQGLIKEKAENGGNPISGARIELYTDQDGLPVPLQYPFYRFAETDSGGTYNFKLGGLKPGGEYYVRAVASHLGYADTFYTDDSGQPKLFTINEDFQNVGELELNEGGTVWGYIKDQAGAPVDQSTIVIQTLLPIGQQVQPFDFYMHDPNADKFEDAQDWDRYYFKYDHVQFDTNARYEIKGLPLDTSYYLKAFEMSAPVFATPIYYDGAEGAYNLRDAETISFSVGFSEAGGVKKTDFILKPGGCIGGDISLGAIPEQGVLNSMSIDPNIFNDIPIAVNAYRIEDYGTLTQISRDFVGTGPSFLMFGQDPYSVCGLSPGDYLIMAYDSSYKFYPGTYYNDGETITITTGQDIVDKHISLSLGAMLTGRVLDSSENPIPNISVSAYRINTTNPLVGYYFLSSDGNPLANYPAMVDPNDGRFYIWGLPMGSYTFYADGFGVVVDPNIAYLPQYYAPDMNGTMIPSQAYPVKLMTPNDPNFTVLEDIHFNQSGVASGGIISGNISSNSSSSTGFYLQVFNADTGLELYNFLYRLDPNTGDYSVMVQHDANYILAARDSSGSFLPHYYNGAQGTANPAEAQSLLIDSSSSSNKYLTQIDFNLGETGGYVSGQVLDEASTGASGLQIYAKQEILSGPKKGLWTNVDKIAITGASGNFTLTGLYPGTYKFSVHDPFFTYAAQFYHSDPTKHPYTSKEAEEWEFDLNNPNQPIEFHVQKGGGILGIVTGVPDAQVYAYLKTDGATAGGYTDTADPNFNLSGLIPGDYILCYKDPDLDYLTIYYNQSGGTSDPDAAEVIPVSIGVTEGPKNFTQRQLGAGVEGAVKDSETNPGESISGIYIFLYPISRNNKPWTTEPEQYDISDLNGYSLRGLSVGDYWITAVLGNNRPVSRKLTIADSDIGGIKQDIDIIFPQDWQDLRYSRTINLEKGLNLVAYPTLVPIPTPPYFTGYTSKSLLQDIALVNGRTGMHIKTYFPDNCIWKSTTYGNTSLAGAMVTSVVGDNFYPRNGQGYLFYSEKAQKIDFLFYPGQTAIWLSEGLNLIGNVACDPNMVNFDDPNIISDNEFTTRKMLAQLGEDDSASIQTLDAKTGRWQATYWMWGRPAGANVKVEDDRGYLVNMKKDRDEWYPKR